MLKFPHTMIANEIQRSVVEEMESFSNEEIKRFYRKQNILVDFTNRLMDETGIISPLQQKFFEMWIPHFAISEMKREKEREARKFIYEFCEKLVEFKGLSSYQFTYILYFIAECYPKKKN